MKIKSINKIRTKLLLFFFVIGVVPLLVMGVISVFLIDLTRGLDVADLEQELINFKVEEIEKFFIDTLGPFEVQTDYEQTIEPATTGRKVILDGMLSSNRYLKEVSFVNLQGEEISRQTRNQGQEPLLRDKSETKEFQTALSGQTALGELSYMPEGPEISLAGPVRNKNREVVAVLSGVLDISLIQKRATLNRLGNSGYLYIVDNKGKVLAHSSKPEAVESDFGSSSIVSSILQGAVKTGRADSDRYVSFWKEKVIGAGSRIRDTGWAVIAEWPEQDALLPARELRGKVIQISLLVFLLVVGFSSFVAFGISRPLNELKKGTKMIEKGKFDHRIALNTGDEIEDLGAAFNRMARGLKRLEELRNEFVFIAAHQLRAPVTAIRGYVSMILEGDAGPTSPTIQKFLSPVMRASDGLNQLVNDLLEVARSEAGRIEIETKPSDIVQEVKAVLEQLKVLAQDKSIELIYEPQPDLPKAMADPDKLREVIKNLVDNAIKYTIKTGETITVSHETNEKELITRVKDSGVGMSKENQEKLFKKFFRAKTKETQDITGTGLGLWIVKQLVEKMKGKIWVESEEGKGSTFSFSLSMTND